MPDIRHRVGAYVRLRGAAWATQRQANFPY